MLRKHNLAVVTSVPPFLRLVFFLGSTAVVVFCWRTVLTSGCFGNVCGRFPGFTSFNFSCIGTCVSSQYLGALLKIYYHCDCLRQHFKNLGVIKSCELMISPPSPPTCTNSTCRSLRVGGCSPRLPSGHSCLWVAAISAPPTMYSPT